MCTELGLPYPIKLILEAFPESILFGGAVRDLISGDEPRDYDILLCADSVESILNGFFAPFGYSVNAINDSTKLYKRNGTNVSPILIFNKEEAVYCDLVYYSNPRDGHRALYWYRTDFDVNSLCMTTQGIYCRNPDMYETVVEHIKNRQMILTSKGMKWKKSRKILSKRLRGMIDRGWTLIG